MADYNSLYTGAEIDDSVGKVKNADTTPTSGSTDMITSGAVYTALNDKLNLSGGTMTGDINMNSNAVNSATSINMASGGRVTNLATASDSNTAYAANVAYVLAKISGLSSIYQTISGLSAAVLAVVLTGLSTATNAAIEATDTIIVALGKLQSQINSLSSTVSTNTSNIATNTSNISTLDSTVSSLSSQVDTNTSNISSLDTNKANLSGATFTGSVTLKQAIATSQTLTDGTTINWDLSLGNAAVVTLGGNRTMAAPTNLAVGTYILKVIQDATGSRTITWNSNFKWTGGTAPTLSTTANAVDLITFYCDGTNMISSTTILKAIA